jgi:hypothetical protein
VLYGRDEEQARVSSLIDEARDHRRSGVLLLRREAGIGKSALLAQAADRAPRVLRVTGIEADSGIAFASPGLPELRLHRLPRPDAERVLAESGLVPIVRDRVAAGNPLALQELAATGHRRQDGSRPLPITDRVLDAFRVQIERLPESTGLMLLIAAAAARRIAVHRALAESADDLYKAYPKLGISSRRELSRLTLEPA